ncbi:MAG: hypothetical protein KDB69_04545 [Acidimicrobiia bacterium]|nr:hypothetical protein [Acidimicrobiia bacterium]
MGNRAVRALLSDPNVEYLGVLSESVPKRRRSGPIERIDGFDVLMSDGDADIHRLMGMCAVEEVALVLWSDGEPDSGPRTIPVVHGANVASGLIGALAAHPTAAVSDEDKVTVGWTEPGTPLKRGIPIAFPDPIGPSWGKARSNGEVVAFRDDEWAGAVVDVDGPKGRRIIGVADHAAYMEALVLSAATLAAGSGVYETGSHAAASRGEQLLNFLYDMELEIAVWSSNP